jgi:hypothetical protein
MLLKEGGAIAALVVVFFILKLLMPLFQARTANGGKNGRTAVEAAAKSGELSPTEWEGRMEKLHQESEERLMEDMRSLMNARTLTLVEKVTQPIVAEIRALREDLARRG